LVRKPAGSRQALFAALQGIGLAAAFLGAALLILAAQLWIVLGFAFPLGLVLLLLGWVALATAHRQR
jgi:hypothetical protein